MDGLVQRRKAMAEEMMRGAIGEAASGVLATVGYTALTMDRVAEAAGVSKGTLYNYYQDKDALVLEVIDQAFTVLAAKIDETFADTSPAQWRLRQMTRLLITGIEELRALGQASCTGPMSPRLSAALRERQMRMRERFVLLFRQAAAAGELRSTSYTPDELGRFLVLMVDGIINERILHAADCPDVDRDVAMIDECVLQSWFKEAP